MQLPGDTDLADKHMETGASWVEGDVSRLMWVIGSVFQGVLILRTAVIWGERGAGGFGGCQGRYYFGKFTDV